MSHVHTWRLTSDLVLTLPEASGYREKVLTWICAPCGQYTVVHGSFHTASGAVTLPEIEARLAQEQRAGTPLARVARTQQRRRGA